MRAVDDNVKAKKLAGVTVGGEKDWQVAEERL